MAVIPGVNIPDKVVPYTTSDDYATHDEEYGCGGYRSVVDGTARLAIPYKRLKLGMEVFETGSGFKFRLHTMPAVDTLSTDYNWTQVDESNLWYGV